MERYKTFAEFWPFYVSQHLNRTNRRMHFAGTSIVVFLIAHLLWMLGVVLFEASVRGFFFSIIFPVTAAEHVGVALLGGYGFAWAGHFFFEKNKPATFRYPLWSLRGDLKLYGLMWQRKMDEEMRRLRDLYLIGHDNCECRNVYK